MSRRALITFCLCLCLLVSCNSTNNLSVQTTPGVNQPGSNLPSPTTQRLSGLLQTEQLLLMTPSQASNFSVLAQRLKGLNPGNLPQFNPRLGENDTFQVYNQDTRTYSQIRAHLVAITAHTCMYVEDGQPFNQEALQIAAEAFEQQIYATSSNIFGSDWLASGQKDAHLTILNTVALGRDVGGTFSPLDEYPTNVIPYSNQRQMLYINLDGEIPGSAGYAATLTNELQRLIDWYKDPLLPGWMNEGMSILAQHMNDYSAEGVDQAFLQETDTQLNASSVDPALEPASEGADYLFMDYFVQHYGGDRVLKELLEDATEPPTNFDDVLAKNNYRDRFTDVLGKWMVANFIADPSIDDEEYGYPGIHMSGAVPEQTVNGYPFAVSSQVHQYAAEYYNLHAHPSKGGLLTIQFNGAPTVRLVGNNPLGSEDEWWSNYGNDRDSTLTRSFDLSSLKGHQATLQFAAWFDLARNSDYAFVEVSTDGGTRWTTLKGKDTTTSNPDGLNWGNGYTGVSGGGAVPVWVQESVDLTPYAGKKIKLRFEEVTSNPSVVQGFALDQIAIPALNFQDHLTSDNGWVSSGFVRSNNVVPEHYFVQAIIYTGSTFRVQKLEVDLASARGTWTISHFGNQVTRVVLVVAAYALKTTFQAHYQLAIRTT